MKNKFTILLLASISCISISFTACDSGYANSSPSYEEAQLTIEQTENLYPTQFLHSDGTFRKNLVGKWVVEGSIRSSATIANYKDMVLEVNYYSKTNSLVGTERHTVYEYLTPGKAVKFKFKSFGYKGAENVRIDITNASPIN